MALTGCAGVVCCLRLASLYGEEGARGEGPRPALVEALVYEASVMAHVKGTGGFDARSAATTAHALRHMGIGTPPQGQSEPVSSLSHTGGQTWHADKRAAMVESQEVWVKCVG